MRLLVPLVIALLTTGCAENYYACRAHGGAREYCGFATRPPPTGVVVGLVSL